MSLQCYMSVYAWHKVFAYKVMMTSIQYLMVYVNFEMLHWLCYDIMWHRNWTFQWRNVTIASFWRNICVNGTLCVSWGLLTLVALKFSSKKQKCTFFYREKIYFRFLSFLNTKIAQIVEIMFQWQVTTWKHANLSIGSPETTSVKFESICPNDFQ